MAQNHHFVASHQMPRMRSMSGSAQESSGPSSGAIGIQFSFAFKRQPFFVTSATGATRLFSGVWVGGFLTAPVLPGIVIIGISDPKLALAFERSWRACIAAGELLFTRDFPVDRLSHNKNVHDLIYTRSTASKELPRQAADKYVVGDTEP